jgi:hypothetical protein
MYGMHSKELTDLVKAERILGKVWVSPEQGLICFDLEGE